MNAIRGALFGLLITLIAAAPKAQAQTLSVAEPKTGMPSQSVLASAKVLYSAASYEAALLELSATNIADDPDQVDTYRALCFLALDRPKDAEQVIEKLVARRPLYAITDSEYSPRLVAMFHDVRKRTLPSAATQLYASAKSDYEGKSYVKAAAKFKELTQVLGDADLAENAGRLSDLRELADGFLKLSEQKVAELPAAAPAAAAVAARGAAAPVSTAPGSPTPAGAPAAVSPTVATASTPAPQRLYTAVDAGIRQPMVIQQTLPHWTPPQQTQFLRNRTYTGRIELVINEQGTVEKALIVKSVWPTYDAALLQAAKAWKYQPAQLNGQPVKFVKSVEITVN
jgi:TonB family protein